MEVHTVDDNIEHDQLIVIDNKAGPEISDAQGQNPKSAPNIYNYYLHIGNDNQGWRRKFT